MFALLPLLPLLPLIAGAALPGAMLQEPEGEAPPVPGLHFPPGPAADAWATVGEHTHARLPARAAEIPTHAGDPRWDAPEPWLRWAALVEAEAAATARAAPPDATRRAELALFALGQGRGRGAWAHFTACNDPELLAGLAPRFLPGAPPAPAHPLTWHSALPDGVLLRPALPPPTPGVIEGRVDRRGYTLEGLAVGDAVLSLTVTQEPDGIQIDVEHRSGGEARLQLVIPAPPFLDVHVEYLDWERQDTIGEPLTLRLLPGDERHTLWARFRLRDRAWPGEPAPGALPQQLREYGVILLALEGDPETPRLTAVAGALAKLFPAPCSLLLLDTSTPRPTGPATVVDLRDGPDRARKLAALLSMAERERLGGKP